MAAIIEHRYTVEQLLKMQELANQVDIDFDYTPCNAECEAEEGEIVEVEKQLPAPVQSSVAVAEDVIRFRKNPVGGNEVKFHMDKDVPLNQIVHVYNLAQSVEWPHVSTFCKKTIGIKPFDIRMMRRSQPTEARIIFNSSDEAAEFLSKITPETKLKGKVAKFVLENSAPRGSSTNHSKVRDEVDVPATRHADIPSAVLWDGKKRARQSVPDEAVVQEAAFVEDDDCCGKAKPNPQSAGLVASAVVLDSAKMGSAQVAHAQPIKMGAAAKKPAQGRRGPSGPARGGKGRGGKSVTGICVGQPASLAANMEMY